MRRRKKVRKASERLFGGTTIHAGKGTHQPEDSFFQAVRFRLTDLATEIQAGRHLTYRAVWLQDLGHDSGRSAPRGCGFYPALPRGGNHARRQGL